MAVLGEIVLEGACACVVSQWREGVHAHFGLESEHGVEEEEATVQAGSNSV